MIVCRINDLFFRVYHYISRISSECVNIAKLEVTNLSDIQSLGNVDLISETLRQLEMRERGFDRTDCVCGFLESIQVGGVCVCASLPSETPRICN